MVFSLHAVQDRFESEQADIVNIVESRERRSEGVEETGSQWNKFNGDLACRVVKEFLKKHLPKEVKVVGPNVYIDGYPTEFDLLLVTEDAIPAAFTNAYRDRDVRFIIQMKSHRYTNLEFPSKLLSEFKALTERYKNLNCTYLTIRETLTHNREASISHIEELKKVLEPKYRAFCLAESRAQEIIPGQWRQFVNHVSTGTST